MTDRRVAHDRPLVHGAGVRRSLVNVGGAVETEGDATLAAVLSAALAIEPGAHDAAYTHPFHAYPARLHPAVAASLVRALSSPADVVLDPFCGSGTVLVEARVSGRRAVGRDLSPFAVELARLKCRKTTVAERKAMQDAVRAVTEAATVRAARAPVDPPRGESTWFAPHTLRELAALRHEIARTEGFSRDALRMLLSSVLVKVSHQASDSSPARVDKRLAPGEALRLFSYKSNELKRCLTELSRALPPDAPAADIAVDDATVLTTVPDASADLVVTSPPYANTYDYVSHHARRYAWLDLDDTAMRAAEVGAARWFADPAVGAARFASELAACCAQLARVLRPGGRAVLVIADGAAGSSALRADVTVTEGARAAGLIVRARASQPRGAFDADSRSAFGRRPRHEHAILLQR